MSLIFQIKVPIAFLLNWLRLGALEIDKMSTFYHLWCYNHCCCYHYHYRINIVIIIIIIIIFLLAIILLFLSLLRLSSSSSPSLLSSKICNKMHWRFCTWGNSHMKSIHESVHEFLTHCYFSTVTNEIVLWRFLRVCVTAFKHFQEDRIWFLCQGHDCCVNLKYPFVIFYSYHNSPAWPPWGGEMKIQYGRTRRSVPRGPPRGSSRFFIVLLVAGGIVLGMTALAVYLVNGKSQWRLKYLLHFTCFRLIRSGFFVKNTSSNMPNISNCIDYS